MVLTTFPITTGETDSIDSRLLPDGLIYRAENLVLERDGRLAIRAAYTNLGLTTYGSGTFVPYDLGYFKDRVIALGDRLSLGRPSDVYELMPTGSARDWRPSNPDNFFPRLPLLHSPELLGQQVDQQGGVSEFQQAVTTTHVAMVFRSAVDSYCHIVRADTNQTVLFEKLDATNAPETLLNVVSHTDGSFSVVGVASGGTSLSITSFDPSADVALSTPAVLFSGTTVTLLASAADGNNIVVSAGRTDGNIVTSLFTQAGTTVQAMGTITGETAVAGITEPNSTGDVAVCLRSNGIKGVTLNTGTGSIVAGPTALTSTVGLGTTNAGVILVTDSTALFSVSLSGTPTVIVNLFNLTSATFPASGATFPELTMTATPALVASTTTICFGAVTGSGLGDEDGEPSTSFYQARYFNSESLAPVASLDFGLGAAPLNVPPAVKFSGEDFYLPRLATNEDELPGASLLKMSNSADRRQMASVGTALYIAGGMVSRYAGRTLVESNFHERPRIITLTGSNGAGSLLGSAEYDYRLHWEWIDEGGELCRSPVSDIFTLLLGATEDTGTAVCSTPHSMRTSGGAKELGSSVRAVLSRTAATVSQTAAVLTGDNVIDFATVSFGAKSLFLILEDSAGTINLSHLFVGEPTDMTDLVSTLNGDSSATGTGRAIYSNVGNKLVVSTVELGEDVSISVPVSPSSANIEIGWNGSAVAVGTVTRTKGTVFHRSDFQYIPTSDVPGTNITITDTRQDQSDPINTETDLIAQGIVYTQSNPTGSDVSPLPSEYVSSGLDRLIVSGQPNRSQWQVSKLSVRNQALAFADESLLSFSGEIRGDIVASIQFGEVIVLWTDREMWAISGQGPALNGAGEYFAPRRIPTDGGMTEDGWKSIVQTHAGLFFQLDNNKIYVLDRSLNLTWVSHPVTRRLEDFPVVTDAVHAVSTQEIYFALENSGSTDGGIIRFDIRTGQWFFDPVGATTALTTQGNSVLRLSGGVVSRQDSATTASTAVFETGDFQGFSRLGWGQVISVGLFASYRGPCDIKVDISPDAGNNWSELGLSNHSVSEYNIGDAISLSFEPATQMLESFRLRVTLTPEAGSAGVRLHAFSLETTKSPFTQRLSSSQRS